MQHTFAAFFPLAVALIGGFALTRSLRAAPGNLNIDQARVSARRWVRICLVLIVCGPFAHGAVSVVRHGTMPTDAIFGCWFLLPLSWFLYDWDRTWERLLAEGARQGYSVSGSASLLRFVTAGIVLMGFWLLLLSVSGTELPSRYPLHSVQPTKR